MTDVFYDAADAEKIPPGSAAALAVDGIYAAAALRAAPRLGPLRWITVTGDGRHAGIIDWEPGNPCFTPAGLRGFVRERRAMNCRARIYVQRSLAAEAIAALRDFGAGDLLAYPRLLWWIPIGSDPLMTAAQLAADLAQRWNAPIPESQLWAMQAGQIPGPVDVDYLFGEW